MTIELDAELQQLLRRQADSILTDWQARLLALGGNHQRGLVPQTELRQEMTALLSGLAERSGNAVRAALPAGWGDENVPVVFPVNFQYTHELSLVP